MWCCGNFHISNFVHKTALEESFNDFSTQLKAQSCLFVVWRRFSIPSFLCRSHPPSWILLLPSDICYKSLFLLLWKSYQANAGLPWERKSSIVVYTVIPATNLNIKSNYWTNQTKSLAQISQWNKIFWGKYWQTNTNPKYSNHIADLSPSQRVHPNSPYNNQQSTQMVHQKS